MTVQRRHVAALVTAAAAVAVSLTGCGAASNPAGAVSSLSAAAQSAASAVQSAASQAASALESAQSQVASAASQAASAAESAASSALASVTGGEVPPAAVPVVEAWWKDLPESEQKSMCEQFAANPVVTTTAQGGAIWAKVSMDAAATAEQKAVTGPQFVAAVSAFLPTVC